MAGYHADQRRHGHADGRANHRHKARTINVVHRAKADSHGAARRDHAGTRMPDADTDA